MFCTQCGAKATENDRVCPNCKAPLGVIGQRTTPDRSKRSSSKSSLVYPREDTLFILHAILSALFWLVLIVVTVGIALVYILLFFVAYLFAQSALISWLKGNGIRVGTEQYPELHARYVQCCHRLGMAALPEVYLLNGDGMLNAFATRFLGRNFVVLYSSVVDALAEHPDAINFYIGHELGHIQRKHLQWGPFIWPASILPLLGAAYSRAREYTCDQYGRACCEDPHSALLGLATLAAGERLWSQLSIPAFVEQAKESGRFWMAFHELLADYPWLVKRAARLENPGYTPPGRNFFAWLLALFVPRTGLGGGGASLLIVIAMIGVLAAVAIPAFHKYQQRLQEAQQQYQPPSTNQTPELPADQGNAAASAADVIPIELLVPVELHLANLRAGEVDSAYNATSPDFKKSTSLNEYKQFLQSYPMLTSHSAFNPLTHSVDASSAQVTGHLSDGTKNLVKVEFTLVPLDSNWLIQGLNLAPADP